MTARLIRSAALGAAIAAVAGASAFAQYRVVVPTLPPAGGSGGAYSYTVLVPALPPAGSLGGSYGGGGSTGGDFTSTPLGGGSTGGATSGGTSARPDTSVGREAGVGGGGGSGGGAGGGTGGDPFQGDEFAGGGGDETPPGGALDDSPSAGDQGGGQGGGGQRGGGAGGGGELFEASLPDDVQALNADARRMLLDGDAEGALELAEEALAAAPDAPEMWDTLGHIYASLGREDEALSHFFGAVIRQGSDGDLVRSYEEALFEAGYLQEQPNDSWDGLSEAALRACVAAGCSLMTDN